MRQYSNRSQRGFSLMEILVGFAIISIILGMTMLNYSTVLPNYKANSAMDQLLYQLRSARERHMCVIRRTDDNEIGLRGEECVDGRDNVRLRIFRVCLADALGVAGHD